MRKPFLAQKEKTHKNSRFPKKNDCLESKVYRFCFHEGYVLSETIIFKIQHFKKKCLLAGQLIIICTVIF
ncbi:MAG: hypothetical protein A2007_00900 [Verrucomicrobia bacterium GWC2_42_7]|nr:MAG: hypothetical protein A2007_00900 [Verrucomicrobia bacterium GWC2_42_7]